MRFSSINLRIVSIDAGWLKAQLTINDQSYDFTVSYLSEPLQSLLETLIELDAYYDGRYAFASDTKPQFHLIWQGEPWRYNWLLEPLEDQCIKISITFCEDHVVDKKTADQLMLETIVSLREFTERIYEEAERILKGYGFLGYKQVWIQSEYPIGELFRLYYILHKQAPHEKSLETEVEYLDGLLHS